MTLSSDSFELFQITDCNYGVRGSIFRKTFEDGTYHQYGFDVLGRVKTHRTPKGEICTITYDDRNRVEKKDWSTATSDTDYQYFDNGLVKQIDNGVSKSDSTYTVRNELKIEIQTLAGGVACTLTYGYDDDGLAVPFASDTFFRLLGEHLLSRRHLRHSR